MDIHDVALEIYARLVSQPGKDGTTMKNDATTAYHCAEAFMEAMDDYKTSHPSRATVQHF